MLLSYYSTEFDRAIYGSQKTQSIVALADSEPREIELFVTWLTTGSIPWKRLTGDPELENLWVLGKLLGAPSFCNSVMYLIFTDYDWWSLNAEMAGYAFEHTAPSDKLRLFMVDLIRSNGPFSEKSNLSGEEKARWVELLAKGGEVVRCLVEGGFDKESEVEPTMVGEWWRYLEREDYWGMVGGKGPGEWRRERVEEVAEVKVKPKEKVELPTRVLRSGKRV